MTDPTLPAERLRAFAQEYAERYGPDPDPIYGIWPGTNTPVVLTVDDLLAVADEIERLRAEVRKCHRLNGWSKSKGWWCACGEWSLRRHSTDPFERPWDYRPTEAHGEHVDALLAAATPQEER